MLQARKLCGYGVRLDVEVRARLANRGRLAIAPAEITLQTRPGWTASAIGDGGIARIRLPVDLRERTDGGGARDLGALARRLLAVLDAVHERGVVVRDLSPKNVVLGDDVSLWPGVVVRGDRRGRELGYPTANLSPDSAGFVPADGVYAGWLVDAHGTRWPTAISVGSNPTFENVPRQVEAHVIDRPAERVEDFDLYGQRVVVEFVERLRGMVAYEGVDKLVAQMDDDVVRTRRILAAEA